MSRGDPRGEMAASNQGVPPMMGSQQKVLWEGLIKHKSAGTMVELCTLVSSASAPLYI